MRNWASSYGAAVRQHTVRQETTMAKHGTLPKFIYQRQCVASDKPVPLTTFVTEQTVGRGGEGVLPYMSYTGMCRGLGYGFWRFSILK